MSDKTHREAMEREKARLLEEAAAKKAAADAIDCDMVEIDRLAQLAAKYGFAVTSASDGKKLDNNLFDGTLAGLIDCYTAHPRSGYRSLEYATRRSYDSSLARLKRELGTELIENLNTDRIQRAYDSWTENRTVRLSMGHSLIAILRILATFGSTVLNDKSCREIRVTLHYMKFKKPEKKTMAPTAVQVSAICAMAHLKGFPSIALAQAIQSEGKLLQKDVIGEWSPVGEAGTSEIMSDGMKWVRGLRWNEINEKFEVHRLTKGRHAPLKLGPLVRDQLWNMFCKSGEMLTRHRLPVSGPVIVFERTGLPYLTHQFRRTWRQVADAASVPKNVKNRDSRSATDDEPEVDIDMELAGQK